jgi:5-methylthioadenosine/S-adenosylhomocysteine deaminase
LKVLDKDGNIKDVFVGGKKVVEDGNLITMDMQKDIEAPLKKSLNKLFIF